MPSLQYQAAFAALSPSAQTALTGALGQLEPRVKANIEDETALQVPQLIGLLQAFSDALAKASAAEAWLAACRAHQLKGQKLSGAQCPQMIGRVKLLSIHVKDVASAYGDELVADEVAKLILKYSGESDLEGNESYFQQAALAQFIAWASFDPNNGSKNPFDQYPASHSAICSALGLGYFDGQKIVALVLDHALCGAPPLHRPSIAEAEDSPYFRIHPNPAEPHGWTLPLPHSPNLPAQPEVVLRGAPCSGLQLPFHVFHP